MPSMPMLHILSANGFLLSYNFLNLSPNATSLCCAPQIIGNKSGLHLFKNVSISKQIKKQEGFVKLNLDRVKQYLECCISKIVKHMFFLLILRLSLAS